MLSASIVITPGSAQVAEPGDTVNALHFDFKGAPKITHLDVGTTPGSTTALTDLHLFAGTVDIGVDINKAEWKLLKRNGGTVRGTVPEDAPDGATFQYIVSAFTPLRPRQKISVSGGPASVFTVDNPVEVTVLHLEINGPPTTSFSPDTNDVNFANVTYDTTGNGVDVQNMFIAFESRDSSDGSLIENVEDFIHNVDIRFTSTGAVIHAESPILYEGLVVYSVPDFVLIGDGTFQILGDLTGPPEPNLQLRVHVVTAQEGTVNIGGLTGQTNAFNLKAVDLDTGAVVDVEPGGVINGNFQKVVQPEVFITGKNIGTTNTAVKNQEILLYRFESSVPQGADILLTQFIFSAQAGSLLNATDYELDVDTDGNGTAETRLQYGVSPQNSQVTFNNLVGGGFVNPVGGTVVYEVRARVASSLVSDTLQLKFDTANSEVVQAETVSTGSPLSSEQIHITTAPSILWHLQSQGNLIVMPDFSAIQSEYLLPGANNTIMKIRLRAEYEDIAVTQFVVSLDNEVQGEDVQSVNRGHLYRLGETVPFAAVTTAAAGGINAQGFYTQLLVTMNNNELVVPKGQDVVVRFVPDVMTDDEAGQSVSGEIIRANIISGFDFNPIEARGVTSSNQLDQNTGAAGQKGAIFIGVEPGGGPNLLLENVENTVAMVEVTSAIDAHFGQAPALLQTGLLDLLFTQVHVFGSNSFLNGRNYLVIDDYAVVVNTHNVAIDRTSGRLSNAADRSTSVAATQVLQFEGFDVFLFEGLEGGAVDTRINDGETPTFVFTVNVTDNQVNENDIAFIWGAADFSSLGFGWVDRDAVTHVSLRGTDLDDDIAVGQTFGRPAVA